MLVNSTLTLLSEEPLSYWMGYYCGTEKIFALKTLLSETWQENYRWQLATSNEQLTNQSVYYVTLNVLNTQKLLLANILQHLPPKSFPQKCFQRYNVLLQLIFHSPLSMA